MTISIMVGGHGSSWPSINLSNIYLPTKIIAGEDLARGAFVSLPLTEAKKIILNHSKFQSVFETERSHEIFFQGTQLYCKGAPASSWVGSLTLAEDVHSEVASLSITSDPLFPQTILLVLTITKTIPKGEPLSVWFSSQLASELGLPFLNFSHIKDGRYVCPNCSKKYIAPNPLKLHLATSCDTISSDVLWERIFSSLGLSCGPWKTSFLSSSKTNMKDSIFSSSRGSLSGMNSPYISFAFKRENSTSPNHSDRCLSSNTLTKPQKSSVSKHSLSAFKPVVSTSNRGTKNQGLNVDLGFQNRRNDSLYSSPAGFLSFPDTGSSNSLPVLSSLSKDEGPKYTNISPWPNLNIHSSISSIFNSRLLNLEPSNSLLASIPSTSAGDPCADVEALVSNLGRGKGSHLCLYCGKVYSRKYGLKIHIRTHTGYKPLKCRICLRPFGDPSNLNKHVRLHAQGGTPYGCELCGKVLVRRRDLERHLRSRHSNVVYQSVKKEEGKKYQQSDTSATDCPAELAPASQYTEDSNVLNDKRTSNTQETKSSVERNFPENTETV